MYGCHGCHGAHPRPGPRAPEKIKQPPVEKKGKMSSGVEEEVSSPEVEGNMARVTVRLPEDARLYVDNVTCPLTSSTRSFTTPTLEPGQRYYYTLRAEVTRNGQVHADSKRVTVEAGRESTVAFGDLQPTVSARR
jgi:uncharacterized protein (TIGR03000 family)